MILCNIYREKNSYGGACWLHLIFLMDIKFVSFINLYILCICVYCCGKRCHVKSMHQRTKYNYIYAVSIGLFSIYAPTKNNRKHYTLNHYYAYLIVYCWCKTFSGTYYNWWRQYSTIGLLSSSLELYIELSKSFLATLWIIIQN